MTPVIAETADIATCVALRRKVFIEEQGIAEADELDDLDGQAIHLLATIDTRPVGTARLLRKGATGKIGRVCVLAEARGTGLGAALIRAGIAHFAADPSCDTVYLSAQVPALGFYEKLGFTAEGPAYDDAGIPHRDMTLPLSR
ncbi:GNAT family N-acetyltransferase [Gemmobacter lutimaris]|uniref:GNAT family N-acetyltransferase n=1 Tax=Gemmobacter lutimaris TaxID=2306023 RepID=A0A398BVS0_9RHOB|nr:GNAT family N-acetyltransferase [Gemmobacter lutimaris]RID93011.1 GNAT family N-acetyltransferase [Gemmobacter lutimaris]